MTKKMYFVCEECGKGIQYANNVSHAKNRTKTKKLPNLRYFRVVLGGKLIRRRLCMKCLKMAVRPHADKLRVATVKKATVNA